MNDGRNERLYGKMHAEQEQYKTWLIGQPPQEILSHAYEYSVREDILMAMEYTEFTPAQVGALLGSPCGRVPFMGEKGKRAHGRNHIHSGRMCGCLNLGKLWLSFPHGVQAQAKERRPYGEKGIYQSVRGHPALRGTGYHRAVIGRR